MKFVYLLGRYGLAGAANTALGLAIILACEWVFGLRPEVANATGYVAGWALGYLLNGAFVFKTSAPHRQIGPRYVVAVVLAFMANQAALQVAIMALPVTAYGQILCQVAGMGTYTVVLFVLCAGWVFRKRPGLEPVNSGR